MSQINNRAVGPLPKGNHKKNSRAIHWTRFRLQYLKRNIVSGTWAANDAWWECAKCKVWLEKNQAEIDHIVKRSVRPDLVFEDSNLQILCHHCHMQKHGVL